MMQWIHAIFIVYLALFTLLQIVICMIQSMHMYLYTCDLRMCGIDFSISLRYQFVFEKKNQIQSGMSLVEFS